LQIDWPAPQEGAAEEVELVMLPLALVLIEVVLCAAAKAARAVTRRKRMLDRLRSIGYKNMWKKRVERKKLEDLR
jgi:hypothetical protein